MGKLGKIIYYSVIVLLVLIFVIVLINDSFAGSGFGLYITIALGGIAVLGTLVSSVIHLVNNPKGAKSLIIGAAVLLIVCVIGYAASSGEITNHFLKYGVSTSNESKMIDMGIYLTGFLSIVSVVAILVSEGIGLFKN
jgi:4-amino-4-deoxy-L-arabinose transferase-like glycosyltransferase